jgi:hypothetical protein
MAVSRESIQSLQTTVVCSKDHSLLLQTKQIQIISASATSVRVYEDPTWSRSWSIQSSELCQGGHIVMFVDEPSENQGQVQEADQS